MPTLLELKQRFPRWTVESGPFEFRGHEGRLVPARFRFGDESRLDNAGRPNTVIMRSCVRCSRLSAPRSCSNCGGDEWLRARVGQPSRDGICCAACRLEEARWDCPECGTSNPYATTILMVSKTTPFQALPSVSQGRCFVAAAALDRWETSELEILRTYRDRVMLRTLIGRRFVQLYYRVGPTIAQSVSHTPWFRAVVRRGVVLPAARIARARLQRMPRESKDEPGAHSEAG
jgi:predicted RNA-binding Zn-ribbon protein involved in translation (DUF1610 family)